jgi:glycosyltransferase involved in cell wall biosynthesis
MKVLVNGVNLKVGGGVTVIFNFLKCLIDYTEYHDHEFHVIVPSGIGYEKFDVKPVSIEIMPESMKSPLKRLWLDHTWLKKRILEINPDVVFTMGNIGVPSHKPQGILFMYPYVIYPNDKQVWKLLGFKTGFEKKLRNLIFKSRLQYGDIIFPQTKTSEQRLHKYYPNQIKKTKVIPTAYSKIDSGENGLFFFNKESNCHYLLALSKYYKHKNLEILIDVAKLIKDKEEKIKIITTVEGDQGPGSQEFLDSIDNQNLSDIIINIGKIPFEHVPALYEQVDGLILPTLLESFSATYVDSMMLKVPIFTSDRDFAKDVCNDAAFYFDPMDSSSIFNTIVSAFKDKNLVQKKLEKGYNRAISFPSWYEVTGMFISELEKMVDEKS